MNLTQLIEIDVCPCGQLPLGSYDIHIAPQWGAYTLPRTIRDVF